jgi:hypothetical protein
MDPGHLVVAFADSPAVRETLTVLLEHDCRLRFSNPDRLEADVASGADLALVALRQPARLLRDLTQQWPALPVVAVDTAATTVAPSGVSSVPLQPQAIRTAVLQRLPDGAADIWRTMVCLVVETLRTELTYPFAALRAFAPLDAATAGDDTYALFAAIMREQICVITAALDQLERFQARPRTVTCAPLFATALCRALAQPDTVAAPRGLLCRCLPEAAAPTAAGPVALASLTAALMRAHLQRRSESPIASVRVTENGVVLRYPPRARSASPIASWPLLLAGLTLRRWSWHVLTGRNGDDETISVRPAYVP